MRSSRAGPRIDYSTPAVDRQILHSGISCSLLLSIARIPSRHRIMPLLKPSYLLQVESPHRAQFEKTDLLVRAPLVHSPDAHAEFFSELLGRDPFWAGGSFHHHSIGLERVSTVGQLL